MPFGGRRTPLGPVWKYVRKTLTNLEVTYIFPTNICFLKDSDPMADARQRDGAC